MNTLILIFSKDRALQLDATLRSLFLHCGDAGSTHIRVLYTASSQVHEEQYAQLSRELGRSAFLEFVREIDFRSDMLALLASYEHVLFLVDDNIFVRDFLLSGVIGDLRKNPDSLGFSLRLGRNTTLCYSFETEQRLPDFQTVAGRTLKYDWTAADLDFGYPLEVSSSVFRVEDLMLFLAMLPIGNPNTLEALMDFNKAVFRQDRPHLLCFEQSVTFCAPLNMVQTAWPNKVSNRPEYHPDSLARLFEKGYRIDLAAFSDFVPQSCHQEVELRFLSPEAGKREPHPKVSVIIPCYNYANYLPEAVESVVNQTFQDWECVIVNDGSPDNTHEVARELIAKYPGRRITLVEKENRNGGPSDARNFGIAHSSGEYLLPLDADDKIDPEMLSKTVPVLDEHPEIALVYTHLLHFNDKSGNLRLTEFPECIPEQILVHDCYAYCALFRREAWEEVRGYNINMVPGYEDWDFWVGFLEKGFYARRVPEPLFLYRSKESSLSSQAYERDLELKARIVTNHPTLFSAAQVRWAEAVLNNEPWIRTLDNIRGTIPDLENLKDPNMPVEIMAFVRQADDHIADNDMEAARESIRQALNTAARTERVITTLCNLLSRLGDPQYAREFLKARGIRQ